MDQERQDYADPEPKRRGWWTPLRVTVLVLALIAAAPVVAILAFFAMWFVNEL